MPNIMLSSFIHFLILSTAYEFDYYYSNFMDVEIEAWRS